MPANRTHRDATHIDPHLPSSAPTSLPRSSSASKDRPRRPPNGFIIYRSKISNARKLQGDQSEISVKAGELWRKQVPESDKEKYRQEAKEKMRVFRETYPDYQYHSNEPSKGKKKRRRVGVKGGTTEAPQMANALPYAPGPQAYSNPTSSHATPGWGGNNYSATSSGSSVPPPSRLNYSNPAVQQNLPSLTTYSSVSQSTVPYPGSSQYAVPSTGSSESYVPSTGPVSYSYAPAYADGPAQAYGPTPAFAPSQNYHSVTGTSPEQYHPGYRNGGYGA